MMHHPVCRRRTMMLDKLVDNITLLELIYLKAESDVFCMKGAELTFVMENILFFMF